jgi:HPt (histidine-containing phosphotransfer) domain-containing protein
MKSALANIGEIELSAVARKLEEAGRKQKTTFILEETPAFLTALRTVVEKFVLNKDSVDNETANDISYDDKIWLLEKLAVIQEACAEYDKKAAKDALAHLRQKKWPHSINELLDSIAEHILHSEFAETVDITEKYRFRTPFD